MIPVPGVSGPSQAAGALCSTSKKKFPFPQPESDPFPLLGRKLFHLFGRNLEFLLQGRAQKKQTNETRGRVLKPHGAALFHEHPRDAHWGVPFSLPGPTGGHASTPGHPVPPSLLPGIIPPGHLAPIPTRLSFPGQSPHFC